MKQVLYPRKDILVRNLRQYSQKVHRLCGEKPDMYELSNYAVHSLGFQSTEILDRVPRLDALVCDAVYTVLS